MTETPKDDAEAPVPGFDAEVLLSRGGVSAGMGKCTAVLKTLVPEQTEAAFRRLAVLAGCTQSELLRDLVCLVIHDKTYGEIASDERRQVLGLSSPESGLLSRLFKTSK